MSDRYMELMERVSLHLAHNGYRMDDLSANTEVVLNTAIAVATTEPGGIPGVRVKMINEARFLDWCLQMAEESRTEPVPIPSAKRRHNRNWHRRGGGAE